MRGTIKSKEEIERLFQKGRRSSSSSLTIIVSDNPDQKKGRCAFIAGKKLGSAPFRNRCKRVLRQTSKELNAPFPGYDVIFLAHRSAAKKDHGRLQEEMKKLLKRLEVINE